jgi:hypothetical protein
VYYYARPRVFELEVKEFFFFWWGVLISPEDFGLNLVTCQVPEAKAYRPPSPWSEVQLGSKEAMLRKVCVPGTVGVALRCTKRWGNFVREQSGLW